jgi:hypothetical protein
MSDKAFGLELDLLKSETEYQMTLLKPDSSSGFK